VARTAVVLAGIAALALALAGAPTAGADEPFLAADTTRVGTIDLYFLGGPGARVRFLERVGAEQIVVGDAVVPDDQDAIRLTRAATWRCDRLTRRFEAIAVRPDGSVIGGSYDVRTPSCRERLAIAAPRYAPPGSLVPVTVRDLWGLGGLTMRLCAESPAGGRACRIVTLPAGATEVVRRIRLSRDGRWVLQLGLGRETARRGIVAGVGSRPLGPARPRLLVTGDSTAQGLDAYLADRLARTFRVARDFRIGTGISQELDRWPQVAAEQASRFAPRVTVVSIGANDGLPMTTADGRVVCCDEAWRAAYARRARQLMTAYLRNGSGHVLWLRLPTPRDPRRQVIDTAVNAAVAAAAAGLPGVTLVPLDEIISPGGTYRERVRWQGRTLAVRAPDGVHLSAAGTSIAADLVVRALAVLPGVLAPG
jgi:lysophospholipase L1-like esterase